MINTNHLIERIYHIKTISDMTSAYDKTIEETIISNKMMQIERMPNIRVFQILGKQSNAKSTYCLYLKINNPNIPQGARVEWVMYDKKYSGSVKFTQPYSMIVNNIKAEVYIQSDNE